MTAAGGRGLASCGDVVVFNMAPVIAENRRYRRVAGEGLRQLNVVNRGGKGVDWKTSRREVTLGELYFG